MKTALPFVPFSRSPVKLSKPRTTLAEMIEAGTVEDRTEEEVKMIEDIQNERKDYWEALFAKVNYMIFWFSWLFNVSCVRYQD